VRHFRDARLMVFTGSQLPLPRRSSLVEFDGGFGPVRGTQVPHTPTAPVARSVRPRLTFLFSHVLQVSKKRWVRCQAAEQSAA